MVKTNKYVLHSVGNCSLFQVRSCWLELALLRIQAKNTSEKQIRWQDFKNVVKMLLSFIRKFNKKCSLKANFTPNKQDIFVSGLFRNHATTISWQPNMIGGLRKRSKSHHIRSGVVMGGVTSRADDDKQMVCHTSQALLNKPSSVDIVLIQKV